MNKCFGGHTISLCSPPFPTPHPPGLVICRPHLTTGFLRLLGERRVETPTYKHLFTGQFSIPPLNMTFTFVELRGRTKKAKPYKIAGSGGSGVRELEKGQARKLRDHFESHVPYITYSVWRAVPQEVRNDLKTAIKKEARKFGNPGFSPEKWLLAQVANYAGKANTLSLAGIDTRSNRVLFFNCLEKRRQYMEKIYTPSKSTLKVKSNSPKGMEQRKRKGGSGSGSEEDSGHISVGSSSAESSESEGKPLCLTFST